MRIEFKKEMKLGSALPFLSYLRYDQYRSESILLRKIEQHLGKNSRQHKNTIAQLRQEARSRKVEITAKFKTKSQHLKTKYSSDSRQEHEV